MSVLSQKHFHNEEAAYKFVESRVWPDGPVCPHCGGVERIGKLKGKSTRIGVYKCYQCRKPFTVKIGTIFESSHIPLRLWLQAIYLIASSKKGISSNQLHRTLGITLKSAWFLSHRIREALASNDGGLLGGPESIVESDETFIGKKQNFEPRPGVGHKMKVLSLMERGGEVRSMRLSGLSRREIEQKVSANVHRESHLMTDTAAYYRQPMRFWGHSTVDHSKGEYVRGLAHVNSLEGYFALFKRGMKGTYQHCREKHLHRYLAEFDYRYNNRHLTDEERAANAINGIIGKRLTYETTNRPLDR